MSIVSASVAKRIQKILRDNSDSPRILFLTQEPVYIQRRGELRAVLLVSTKYYTYLIKKKGSRLYCRWPNRSMVIEAQKSCLLLTTDLPPEEGHPSNEDDDFTLVTVECGSASEAMLLADSINLLIHSAQRAAALLEQEEAGIAGKDLGRPAGDDDLADDDSESSGSEAGDVPPVVGLTRVAGDAPKGRAAPPDSQQGLMKMPPSRYIAITALVDGEFADYTTLKNAYMRKEEESLLGDLAAFIKENEGQVEALCEHHYPAFINAAQQCLAISEKDAQLVGEELSGASALVRSAVVDMKQVAASLIQTRSTRDSLVLVRSLLNRSQAVIEYLETAEAQVAKEQLIGAVASLRELVHLAAPLAEFALGEYVLHLRVPALTQSVFTYAVQHLNLWLKLLRDQATPIGRAALAWQGRVSSGEVVKSIVTAPEGNYWWLTEVFQSASLKMAPFDEGAAIRKVCDGAAIQGVFKELRRDEYFTRYYAEGRAQQVKVDLLDAPFQTHTIPGLELVDRFTQYCSSALGFMLVEDVVYHATSPHIQSCSEILKTWDRTSAAIAERAQSVAQALVSDPAYAERMASVFAILRDFGYHAIQNVKSVELSPLILSRVVESLSDNLISWWLQAACTECTTQILSDTLVPLTVNSAEGYTTNVSRFFLNSCPIMELPIPPKYTSDNVTLPYSAMVPGVGGHVLQFLSQCFSVLVVDSSSFMRQSELNNVDEMLLKYTGVLFRTVSESLKGKLMDINSRSVLQLAVFVSSCSAFPVLVSCVEQGFMLRWQGEDCERQTLGSPKLLASAASLFARPVQLGIEKLLAAFTSDLEDHIKPVAVLSHWKRKAEIRAGDLKKYPRDGEGLAECMDYAMALIPKLNATLQGTVAYSVVGTAIAHAGLQMETCVTSAFSSAYADGERDFSMMRTCLKEFQIQCTGDIPTWQRRLRELMPDLTAVQRFPLNCGGIVEDLTDWLDRREAQYLAEKANQPQLMASIEVTSKAVAKGFKAMGNTMLGRRE